MATRWGLTLLRLGLLCLVSQLAIGAPMFAHLAIGSEQEQKPENLKEGLKGKTPELVIYAQDNFLAQGGLGQEILPIFEKQCQCRVRALSCGDGGQILTRLQLDASRGKQVAHVVVGLDQFTWELAKPELQSRWSVAPQGYVKISNELKVDDGFLPYDYGVLAWMGDLQAIKKQGLTLPHSLKDLLRPEWKRNLILEDPRTSTPGLSFLLYTERLLGAGFSAFWRSFRSQWLTLTPGWDQAYGLFLKQEAPLVWSYLTSQAYHEEHGDGSGGRPRRYQAVLFEEGQPLQIEGAALVKGTQTIPIQVQHKALQFLEFLISEQVQQLIPKKAWMLPVLLPAELPASSRGTHPPLLPDSFKKLEKPSRLIQPSRDGKKIKEILTQWSHTLANE